MRLFRVRSITQDCSWLCAYGFKKIRILSRIFITLHHSCIHYKRFYRWFGSYRCMQHMKLFFARLVLSEGEIKRPQSREKFHYTQNLNEPVEYCISHPYTFTSGKGKMCMLWFFSPSKNKIASLVFMNENSFDICNEHTTVHTYIHFFKCHMVRLMAFAFYATAYHKNIFTSASFENKLPPEVFCCFYA